MGRSLVLILAILASATSTVSCTPQRGGRFRAPATVRITGRDYTCTGVAVGPDRVMTAAHCLRGHRGPHEIRRDGWPLVHTVTSWRVYGTLDLASLAIVPALPPPYAHFGPRPEIGATVRVAGYGCHRLFRGRYLQVRDLRSQGQRRRAPGETQYRGLACPGDSGAGVWDLDGRLVGILWGRFPGGVVVTDM